MFNLKKAVTLTVAGITAIGFVAVGASALNDSDVNANSGSAVVSAKSQGVLMNHEFVGGGEWWYGINFVGWASSDYQHHSLKHAASVRGSTYAFTDLLDPGRLASAGTYRNIVGTTTCHWRTE